MQPLQLCLFPVGVYTRSYHRPYRTRLYTFVNDKLGLRIERNLPLNKNLCTGQLVRLHTQYQGRSRHFKAHIVGIRQPLLAPQHGAGHFATEVYWQEC